LSSFRSAHPSMDFSKVDDVTICKFMLLYILVTYVFKESNNCNDRLINLGK